MIELWNALLAGLIGAVWGLGELVGMFKNETLRSLRMAGAWLLLGVNFLAALLIYLLVAALVPAAATWTAAILVGLAWPTVIRNSAIKLAQPLDPAEAQQTAAVRFEEIYSRVQDLAMQLINGELVRQRLELITRAATLDLSTLERHARIARIASVIQDTHGIPASDYIDRILNEEKWSEEIKKAYLAAFIINNFGRDVLQDVMKDITEGKRKEVAQYKIKKDGNKTDPEQEPGTQR
ncbi:hypothetical protein FKZ61_009315 [Litorilinea aerophila]|uniref:Uncharacterized protein n=1 Tax=Litorilinea aerophila TaxID=1204385 RepID=A0A540VGP3_9CHLR|nr:hypothetical protein [Litorilinea aerophila]MCC9076309.1 hypothetical protein [Litorilinea aerophila]OUC05562.1 hypothetical protein RY27_26530 [Litorilinea aerophila]GIV80614.1 MAG: hypothetical protein KatS3mg050_5008 [Litorilinea sp.]